MKWLSSGGRGSVRCERRQAEGIAQLNHFCLELPFLSSVCQESHSLCGGTWLQYLMKYRESFVHSGAAQILWFSVVFFTARSLCWHQFGFSIFSLTSVDYMEGCELGELCHSREKDIPLEMETFSQLLFLVGEGDLKRSVVLSSGCLLSKQAWETTCCVHISSLASRPEKACPGCWIVP